MKKALSVLISFLLCCAVNFGSFPAFSYTVNSTLGSTLTGSNWMSGIDDNTLISDISIPGTHDSGSKIVDSMTSTWAQCQSMSISQQLEAGVRYLDMRLEYDTTVAGNIRVVHGTVNCWSENGTALSLLEIISDCCRFLDANPSETILFSVKEDDGNNASSLAQAIISAMLSNSSYWYLGYSTPKLGDVRKKIIPVSRISQMYYGLYLTWRDQGSDGGSVDISSNLEVQDRYNMGTANKWENAAKPLLDKTKPNGKFFVNFLSTTGAGISGIPACSNNMNGYFYGYEAKNNKCYGIVVFDYITESLAKKVFQCNDLVSKIQADPAKGQYYFRINMDTSSVVSANWSGVSLRVYYRKNNGTGNSASKLLFINDSGTTDGYQYVCNTGNCDFSGVLDGFPTMIEFYYSFGTGSSHLNISHRLYAGKNASSDLTLIASNDYEKWGSGSVGASGTEYYKCPDNNYPKPCTINFNNNNQLSVKIPDAGSSDSVYTLNSLVCDQYGVYWYDQNITYKLKNTLEGVGISDNKLVIGSSANNNPQPSSTYISANYNYNGIILSTGYVKPVLLNPPVINYRFVNYDGTVLYSGSDYAGVVPSYQGEMPVKPSNDIYHCIFKGWYPSTALSVTNDTYTAQFYTFPHNFQTDTVEPSANEPGGTKHTCMDCGYSYYSDTTGYASDNSVLIAALDKTARFEEENYSFESYSNLQMVCRKYIHLLDESVAQTELDHAAFEILTAISELVPFLNFTVKGTNGTVSVSYEDITGNEGAYPVLFATEVTLTAVPDEGYVFDGWYETVTKRMFSSASTYKFKITSNTDFEARFIKTASSTLTFANDSNQVKTKISKPVDEWREITTISDLLPEVPYKLGYTNGRWVYDEANVLSALSSGEDVTVKPEYDTGSYSDPEVPVPSNGVPALNLYYQLDGDKNIGSFTMAMGVPDNCCIESIGIAFYYDWIKDFNPVDFELTINNKMLTSKFTEADSSGIYIVNVSRFDLKCNWAVRGYVTYYDDSGNLKTAYTNQINIIDRIQVD